jgi:GT2 family glycosyltransferase
MFFSVVVPTCNRPEQLVHCVHGLASQDYPQDNYEVVIVDDGSASPVAPLVVENGGRNVRVLRQRNSGPAVARNSGARHAAGEYIAFTDDDCVPSPTWLGELQEDLSKNERRVVGGRVENGLPNSLYSECSHILTEEKYVDYDESAEVGFLTSNNLVVQRELFYAIGGFDENYARPGYEDTEFCQRLLQNGCTIGYAPRALVYHRRPMRLASFFAQHFNYGRGAHRFYASDEGRANERVAGGLVPFYRKIVERTLVKSNRLRGARLAALVAVSQIASATGFFWEKIPSPARRQERSTPGRVSSRSIRD